MPTIKNNDIQTIDLYHMTTTTMEVPFFGHVVYFDRPGIAEQFTPCVSENAKRELEYLSAEQVAAPVHTIIVNGEKRYVTVEKEIHEQLLRPIIVNKERLEGENRRLSDTAAYWMSQYKISDYRIMNFRKKPWYKRLWLALRNRASYWTGTVDSKTAEVKPNE